MPSSFETKRLNGKTDVQVMLEVVRDGLPGTVFPYADLRAALEDGTASTFTNERVGGVARRACKVMLRERQRTLQAVPTVGYRMAAASDHMPLAVTRQTKADRQLRHSFSILTNVRWEELDPISREVHRAHLNVTAALMNVTRSIMRQNVKRDDSIRSMMERLDAVERQLD